MTFYTISNYILKHERLVIVVLSLLVVLFTFNRWVNYRSKKADESATATQTILQQQEQTVKNLTSQLQQSEANTATIVQQENAQISEYQKIINDLQATLVQQEQKVKVEPLPELTSTWNKLIQIPDGVKDTSQGLVVAEAAARATVAQLIEVPVLTQQNQEQVKQLSDKDEELDAQANTIQASDTLVAGLKTQVTDGQKACTAEVNKVKADARKGKRLWFEIGYAAGLATRGAIKILAGI